MLFPSGQGSTEQRSTEHTSTAGPSYFTHLRRYTRTGLMACCLTGTLLAYQQATQQIGQGVEQQIFVAESQPQKTPEIARQVVAKVVRKAQDYLGV